MHFFAKYFVAIILLVVPAKCFLPTLFSNECSRRLHCTILSSNVNPYGNNPNPYGDEEPIEGVPEMGDLELNLQQVLIRRKRAGGKWSNPMLGDQRDLLPFKVFRATPPIEKIGTFQLDPQTQRGDQLVVGAKEYIIRRVRCKYKYVGGSFVVTCKEADATERTRAVIERKLEGLLPKRDE
uniref:Secreted protein n=1 Tax=Fibrocapsa japonica TaxID=94617 RepID=A0A7S2Y170_9STRA